MRVSRAACNGLTRSWTRSGSARVILVLLSEVSVERRWINFEGGVGIGAQAQVVPIVHRKFTKGNIGLPLSVLQARNLHDPDDVRGLANDVQRCAAWN